ncbi:MAG: DUF1667 domain-containing protein [Romboutsia sp.]
MRTNVTCVVCPMGCRMTIDNIDGEYKVSGNTCKRGEKYGIEEITAPRRVITSTVKLEGSYLNLLPVKTDGSIPKDMMFDVMKVLDNVIIVAPINVGDIIINNILGTGINIVSSKSV